MSVIESLIQSTFKTVSGNTADIVRDAAAHTTSGWTRTQVMKGVTAGAAAAAAPGAVYLTLGADLLYSMRLVHRTATGICAIKLGYADEETFAGVLAVWSGSVVLSSALATQISAKMMAKTAARTGGLQGIKMAISALGTATQLVVNTQMSSKLAAKVAGKFAPKVGVRGATGWIPAVSMIVGGGANWWLLRSVASAAEKYADFILANATAAGK